MTTLPLIQDCVLIAVGTVGFDITGEVVLSGNLTDAATAINVNADSIAYVLGDEGVTYSGAGSVEPLASDRAVWNTGSYPDRHASDIEDATFTYHKDPAVQPLSNVLTDGHIFVGDVTDTAADVAMSGDATIVNTGAVTLATVNGNVGSFKTANVTVNAKGLVTAAANGALNDLNDVNTSGTGTGDVIYNNAGTWEDYPLGLGTLITVSGTKIRFGNVGGGNYLEIDAVTGTLRLAGDATTYDDFRVEASVVKPGATAPNWKAFGPSGSLQALMFEASHHDEAYFEMQMPHNWKLGTNIYPHVHWTPVNTTAGNVVWELEYSWANVGDAFGAPGNMATDATAAGGTAWVHKLTDFKESGNNYISGTGKTLSSMLVCRLHRNSNSGSDTLNQDVALLEVDFHYQIDSLGSDDPLVKDTSASLLLETGDILLLETGDRLLME